MRNNSLTILYRAQMDKHNMTCEDIIVLHLYKNRSHLEDRRLPFAVCREGIRNMEGISIAKVSTGVHNLECSGFIFFEKRYVETKRNPCLTYSLTPMGIMRARIIQLSKLMRPTPNQIEADRVNDIALLRKRALALGLRVVSKTIRIRP